jgi:hypothetical protein
MNEDRGGLTLKTGKIGRVNCVRQQMLLPGETANISLNGSVKLESLRERDSLRINAHLGVFMTPVRWLWEGWPQYLKDGPSGATAPPTISLPNFAALGVGAADPSSVLPRFWRDSLLRVYNEWYKWPEDADATTWDDDGLVAVPLQHVWNRARYDASPGDVDDYELPSATEFDVRDLAALQARFRSSVERDVLSYNRYMELVSEMYNADGSREVDQVPMMIDQVEVGVRPRELPATDGASLGQWQSIFDFDIDHQLKGVVCPEHCIITYMLTVRFAPIIESRAPLAAVQPSWAETVGDPEMLQAMQPQPLTIGQITMGSSGTQLGYVPAGWQWRSGHDVIGSRIDVRDSFPYMDVPTSQANAKDATRVKPAFRSSSLGDYVVDLYVSERTRSPINSALESYFSGMAGEGSKAEFPKQGKML